MACQMKMKLFGLLLLFSGTGVGVRACRDGSVIGGALHHTEIRLQDWLLCHLANHFRVSSPLVYRHFVQRDIQILASGHLPHTVSHE